MYSIKVYYDNNSKMKQYAGEDIHQTAHTIGRWLQEIGKDFENGEDLQKTIEKYGRCELPDGRVAGEITEINTLEQYVRETRKLDDERTMAERRAEVYTALRTINNSHEFSFGRGVTFGQIKTKFEEDIGVNRRELDTDNIKPQERLLAETLYDPMNQGVFTERMNHKAIDMLNKQIGYSHNIDGTLNERAAINEALQNYRTVAHVFANSPDRDMYLEYMRETAPRDLQVNVNYKRAFGSLDSIKAVVKNFDDRKKISELEAYESRAKDFIESVQRGTLPAFNEKNGVVDSHGDIIFHPDVVCLASNGRRIEGLNGLLLEKETRDKGFAVDKEDGVIYVVTETSISDKSKLNPDDKIVISAVDGAEKNNYSLYPLAAGNDKNKNLRRANLRAFPEQKVIAKGNDIEPSKYLGKWTEAAQLGCPFITDKQTMDTVRKKMIEELEPLLKSGQTEKIYDVGKRIEMSSKIEMDKKILEISKSIKNGAGLEQIRDEGIEM